MGAELDDFYALVDQLHGLTIGSFENLSDGEDSDSYLNYYPDDGSNDPYAKFETSELTQLLVHAIEDLPEKERLVLSLYYYEEFTMKEIGALLGVNESRVPNYIRRRCCGFAASSERSCPTPKRC